MGGPCHGLTGSVAWSDLQRCGVAGVLNGYQIRHVAQRDHVIRIDRKISGLLTCHKPRHLMAQGDRDPSGGPPATPARTRDPVPSREAGGGECSRQATMRTRAWSCRCWSVRVGTRIITTGRAPLQAHPHHRTLCRTLPPSRVTLPQSNQRKAPGLLRGTDASSHPPPHGV